MVRLKTVGPEKSQTQNFSLHVFREARPLFRFEEGKSAVQVCLDSYGFSMDSLRIPYGFEALESFPL